MRRILWPLTALLIILALVAGCGGGSGGGNSSLPEAQPYTSEEHAQMETATQVATTTYEAKLASEGITAAATAASEAVSQLPGVAATGASADGSTVWIRFADGTEYALGQLPDMGDVPAGLSTTSGQTRDISDFPGDAGSARVLGSDMDNATTAAAGCFIPRLGGVGYQLDTSTYRGGNLNPATFYKGVTGAQVVLLAGHGAVLREAAPYFGAKVVFVTSITGEPQNWDTYSAFLRANEAMFVEFEGLGARLVLTAKYIRDYCSFAPGSMVLGNFCYSDAPYSEWDDAAVAKGAAAFVGWDDEVTVTAAVMTGNGLADLLTGNRADDALGAISSSMVSGISLPSDVSASDVPMNLGNAKTVLDALGHTGANGNTAKLVIAGDGKWGLRPHLDGYIIGDSRIDLHGYFGSSKGKVFMGSVEQNVISWSTSQIEISLPSGTAQGDMYVQTPQGLKSNKLKVSLVWYERFDVSPAGSVQPTPYPYTRFQGDLTTWMVSGSGGTASNAEITAGKELRLFAQGGTVGAWTDPRCIPGGSRIPIERGLHLGFDASSSAQWAASCLGVGGCYVHVHVSRDAGSANILYLLDHQPGYPIPHYGYTAFDLDSSARYERDLWQDASLALGGSPEGYSIDYLALNVASDAADEVVQARFDNFWIGVVPEFSP